MLLAQDLIGALCAGLLVAILGGLGVRRRLGDCYAFTLYLVAVLVPEVLDGIWPERFYTRNFYLAKEALHQLLKIAIVLELTFRTVSVFPGARHTARIALLAVLLVVLYNLWGTSAKPDYATIATVLLPKAFSGTVWLFCTLALVVLWYRLPLRPFHKAILLGFVVYLLAYSVSLALIGHIGWHVRAVANFVTGCLYVALLAYWTWAAWRPARPEARPGVA